MKDIHKTQVKDYIPGLPWLSFKCVRVGVCEPKGGNGMCFQACG